MKKAQALSLNTVIIAALALLVLIVMALIFTGKIKVFGTETKKCMNMGGTCEGPDGCEPNEATIDNTDCTYTCCIDVYTSADDNEY